VYLWHWPFRLRSWLSDGPCRLALLHNRNWRRLTPFHGKRPRHYDCLRLATVY
jgi:hypothetical protein